MSVIDALRVKGLVARLQDGKLNVGPAELLDDDLRNMIRKHRGHIVETLQNNQLTAIQQTMIMDWLDSIGENNPLERDKTLFKCRVSSAALRYVYEEAERKRWAKSVAGLSMARRNRYL